jgi:hypothetical protein
MEFFAMEAKGMRLSVKLQPEPDETTFFSEQWQVIMKGISLNILPFNFESR